MGLGLDRRRGGVGWVKAARWWARACFVFGLRSGALGLALVFAAGVVAWAQSETDGAIGGRVVNAAGSRWRERG